MLHRDIKLGELAETALVSYHDAFIHAWDNDMERCRNESKGQVWWNTRCENVARRFAHAVKTRFETIEEDIKIEEWDDLLRDLEKKTSFIDETLIESKG